jgi:hypothetical protein
MEQLIVEVSRDFDVRVCHVVTPLMQHGIRSSLLLWPLPLLILSPSTSISYRSIQIAMAQLLDLSIELLTEIIKLNSLEGDRTQPLRHLCLTCTKLRSIAQPMLYSTFHISSSQQHTVKTMILFMRTLVQSPNLAKGVKKVDLELFHHHSIVSTFTEGSHLWGHPLINVQSTDLSYSREWNSWRMDHPLSVYPHVLLLLDLLPLLETIVLRGPDVDISQFKRLAGTTPYPQACQFLKSIDIECPDNSSIYHLATFMGLIPLLQAPLLDKCVLRRAFIFLALGVGPKLLHLDPGSSNITRLELRYCIADARSLEDLILSIRTLKHFTIIPPSTGEEAILEDEARDDPGFNEMDLVIIHRALSSHSNTLESVDFRCVDVERVLDEDEYDEDSQDDDVQTHAQLPSFAAFGSLRNLTINYHRLLSTEFLPKGLHSLALLDCQTLEVEYGLGLDEMCMLRGNACSQLERLDLQVRSGKFYDMADVLSLSGFHLNERPLVNLDADFKFSVHVGKYTEPLHASAA